jgi:hypothetical protein
VRRASYTDADVQNPLAKLWLKRRQDGLAQRLQLPLERLPYLHPDADTRMINDVPYYAFSRFTCKPSADGG